MISIAEQACTAGVPITFTAALEALRGLSLHGFIGHSQFSVLRGLILRGEESQHFRQVVVAIAQIIAAMPSTYQARTSDPKAYLHYFMGGMDWYIIEKDSGAPDDEPADVQTQAFGIANLGYGPERGYISLPEILAAGAELDLYYTPQTVTAIMQKAGAA